MKALITREKNPIQQGDEETLPPDFEWIHLPLIETAYVPGDPARNAAVRNRLESYDYVLFTSANGVRYFSRWLEDQGVPRPDAPQVVCIGEKTACAARDEGWVVSVIPSDAHASEELTEAWARKPMVNRRVLFPKAVLTRAVVRKAIESKGGRVDELHVYETQTREASRDPLRKLALEGMDWIAFFSPSGVRGFCELLGDVNANEWIRRCKPRIASIGRVTSAEIERRGWTVTVECGRPSIQELCDRMVEWERSIV